MKKPTKKQESIYYQTKDFKYRILNKKSAGDLSIYLSGRKNNNHEVGCIKTEKGKNIYINTSLQKDAYDGIFIKLFASDLPYNKGRVELLNLLKTSCFEGLNTIYAIRAIIDQAFKENKVKNKDLYTESEIYFSKSKALDVHGLKSLDKNISRFINDSRFFAGLSYLRGYLDKIHCCLHVKLRKKATYTSTNPKKILAKGEMDFFSIKAWCFDLDNPDFEGAILNGIFSTMITLLNKINHGKLIINLCNLIFEGNHFVILSPSVTVKLIEAQINVNSFEYLSQTTNHLIRYEPHHPIINLSNQYLRKKKLFSEINTTFKAGFLDLNQMNGIEFEEFLEDIFNKKGFKVIRTKHSGDFGADLLVETKFGTRAAIQAKRFKAKTNLKAVQEVVAATAHYSTDFGIVIAISGFFPSAVNLAKSNDVELWDEDKLVRFLSDDLSFSCLDNV